MRKDLTTTKNPLERLAHEIAQWRKAHRPRELIIADAVCELHDAFPRLDYETMELMAEAMLAQHIFDIKCLARPKLMDAPPPVSSHQ